jgi:hypothetical protein
MLQEGEKIDGTLFVTERIINRRLIEEPCGTVLHDRRSQFFSGTAAGCCKRRDRDPRRASDVKDSLTQWNQSSVCEEAWTLVEMYHV